jgi:hypothetical protein
VARDRREPRQNLCDIINAVTTATYLYGIVQAAKRPSVAKAPAGLAGAGPLEALEAAPSIWIIAADVPTDIYAGENLERSLSDLDWVGRVALAHEAVVEHFSRQRSLTVIPLKLFTMFSSREKAVADIRARRSTITRTMKRLAGAEEWGVRVFRSAAPAGAPASRAAAPSTGAAFLAAKKEARDTARAERTAAVEAATHAFDQLSRIARDSQQRSDAPAGAASPPLLNAAFLVDQRRRAVFEKAARLEAHACAQAGAELTLTGPWPAYHFVSPD